MSLDVLEKLQFQSLNIPLRDGGFARTGDVGIRIYDKDGALVEDRCMTDFEKQLLQFVQEMPVVQFGNTRVYPGEPFFVLTARDPQAPGLVERWAWDRAHAEPNSPKIERATYIARMMRIWKTMNPAHGMSSALYPVKYNPQTMFGRLTQSVNDAIASGLRIVIRSRPGDDMQVHTVEVLDKNGTTPNPDAYGVLRAKTK